MRSRRPSTTRVSAPLKTITTSSKSGFCAGSAQPGGASIFATLTDGVFVVALPTNSSMRLPSSRGISLPERSRISAARGPGQRGLDRFGEVGDPLADQREFGDLVFGRLVLVEAVLADQVLLGGLDRLGDVLFFDLASGGTSLVRNFK